MPEEQAEKEPQIKAVEVGEWFRPFENYDEIPYFDRKPQPMGKRVQFRAEGVNWGITLSWEQAEYESRGFGVEGSQVLIVLPAKEIVVKPEEIVNWQKQLEEKLMVLIIGIDDEDLVEDPEKYQTVVRLPSGREIKSQIIEDCVTTEWKTSGKTYTDVFLPDVANIMEKVAVKIEKFG